MKNIYSFLIIILYLFCVNVYALDHSDSLIYTQKVEEVNQLSKVEIDNSSEKDVAAILAAQGLFRDAIDILNVLVLKEYRSDTLQNKASLDQKHQNNVKEKKENSFIDFFFEFNKISDINEKKLNSKQRDSIALKKVILGGVHLKHVFEPEKTPVKEISPEIYLTDITIVPKLKLKSSHVFGLLELHDQFWFEKVIGSFYPDTTGNGEVNDSTDITTEYKYEFNGMKKDSSDLFANVFGMEFSNKLKKKDFVYSVPVNWSFYIFRINKPRLFSKFVYSINPYAEYSFNQAGLVLSGNIYAEYLDGHGEGMAVDGDSLNHFSIDIKDKFSMSPEINLSWFHRKINMEFSEYILYENFMNSVGEYKNLSGIYNKEMGNSITLKPREYETTNYSVWSETNLRFSWRAFSKFTAKMKFSYLYVVDNSVYIAYDNFKSIFFNTEAKEFKKNGYNLKFNPKFDFSLSTPIKLSLEYLHEIQDAPFTDEYPFNFNGSKDSVFIGVRYLWENSIAYEPGIQLQGTFKRVQFKLSQTYRFERVTDNPNYFIDNSHKLKTKWDFYFSINDRITLSSFGLFEYIIIERRSVLIDATGEPEPFAQIPRINIAPYFEFSLKF